jgi:nascent polypeptide-associated complex subunit alpha
LKLGGRDVRRALERLGLNIQPLEGVKEVVIRLQNKEILISGPTVAQVVGQGMTVYQVIGGVITERGQTPTVKELFTEEDVELVAQQAGVPKEVAREALRASGGDLAKAILNLKG